MKKEKIKHFLFISWLLFFLPPIIFLLLPHKQMSADGFVVYLFFVMPTVLLLTLLLEVSWFNKNASFVKILLKYFILFLISYGGLITLICFNLSIGPGL